jgi:hypothetical protein
MTATVQKKPTFKNKKSFERFLAEIDGMGESAIRDIMGDEYIDTPGFYKDEKKDYNGIMDFMTWNMGSEELARLKEWWLKNVNKGKGE